MAAQKKTTALAAAMAAEQKAAEEQSKELLKTATEQKRVPVSLAPQYRAYFGNVMTVCVSGLTVYLPVDGRSYQVPEMFAAEIHRRRRAADDNLLKRQRAAKVAENKENFAGELKIF